MNHDVLLFAGTMAILLGILALIDLVVDRLENVDE